MLALIAKTDPTFPLRGSPFHELDQLCGRRVSLVTIRQAEDEDDIAALDEGPLAPPGIRSKLSMMTGNAALCFDEATNADGVWTVIVRSSHGVIGHIFRAVGEYGYFAGRFNAFTVTISDPSLDRLKARIVASRR